MITINPLIASASPRDIPEVKEAMMNIKSDKVFAKYFIEREAYKHLRNFFLEHKEYTHFVVCPDDLVVTSEAFEKLRKDTELYDYPVLAGVCNNAWGCWDKFACSWKVNVFEGITVEEADRLKEPIIKVEREGFECTWIRRDILENVGLRGVDWSDLNKPGGAAFDWGFCLDCHKRDIPIHVDTSVRMLHLGTRKGIGNYENWGLDKYPPRIEYYKGGTMSSWDNVS